MSIVGVVTAVTSAITGAVVSVVVVAVAENSSLSSPQEIMVRLKQEMSNIFKIFFNLSSKINYQ